MNLFANWSTLLMPAAISLLLALVLMWYVWRALFGDRPRSGPRCLKCNHPFTESQDLTCVECGWTARRPSDLTKPRRHWFQAVLGVVLLVGGATLLRLRVTGEHPIQYVPNGILVGLLPYGTSTGGDLVHDEIDRRLMNDEFSENSLENLVRGLLDGDQTARPVGAAWQARYGPLLDRWRQGYASPGNPMTLDLLRLPADVSLEIAPLWPIDDPVPASLAFQDWWPVGTEVVVDLRWASTPDAPPLHSVGYRNDASIARRHQFTLPPAGAWPTPPDLELTFREPRFARLGRTPLANAPELTGIASKTISPLTPPADLLEVALVPWSGDDAALGSIEQVFQPGMQRWTEAVDRPYAMRFDPRHLARDAYDDVLFGLVVEVVEKTRDAAPRVRRRTEIWALGGSPETVGRRLAWDISEEDTDGLAGAFDPTSRSEWTLRVHGDETIARRALGLLATEDSMTTYRRWWSGSLSFPLRTTTRQNAPFRRMWFRPGGVRPPAPPDRP